MNSENVLLAVIAATPVTIAAFAGWRAARKTRSEVQTTNGLSVGKMIEHIHEEQGRQGARVDSLYDSHIGHVTDLDIHRDRRRGAR